MPLPWDPRRHLGVGGEETGVGPTKGPESQNHTWRPGTNYVQSSWSRGEPGRVVYSHQTHHSSPYHRREDGTYPEGTFYEIIEKNLWGNLVKIIKRLS